MLASTKSTIPARQIRTLLADFRALGACAETNLSIRLRWLALRESTVALALVSLVARRYHEDERAW
jgi:hypothetical protein